MKKLYIILLALIAVKIASAQDWQWLNPLPQGNNLHCVMFADANTGYAAGDLGTILKTSDGGETWDLLPSGTTVNLYSVFFTDANAGYAVGGDYYGNVILKTNDGGSSWTSQNLGTGIICLNSVFFINDSTGFIAGRNDSQSPYLIFKTTDGGMTWTSNSYGTDWNMTGLKSIFFITADIGYAVGGTLLKTTDGGANWSDLNNVSGNSVFFTDENTGYICGDGEYSWGRIQKTTNGGLNWTTQYTDSIYCLSSVFFTSATSGYIVGANLSGGGMILITTDEGVTWTSQALAGLNIISSVYFVDGNTGYAVGETGRIIKTADGGAGWSFKSSWQTLSRINDIQFPEPAIGFIVASGTIYKTNDGGVNWTLLTTGNSYLNDIFFINESAGFAVGSEGTITKTTNGGITWIVQNYDTAYSLYAVYFVGQDTGYAIGETFLKTTDGGLTWTNLNNTWGKSLFFTDANTGYIIHIPVDGNDEILKTTNGGLDWSIILLGDNFSDLYFTDPNTGYVLRNTRITYSSQIYKTIDAGITWTYQDCGTGFLSDVYFYDNNTGYAVGAGEWSDYGSYSGSIVKTTDGGLNWYRLNIVCSDVLTAVYFIDAETGYVAGGNGVILKTGNGGGFPVEVNEKPPTSNSLKIYPNPSSDKITIETIELYSQCQLSILNLNGKELITRQITDAKTVLNICNLQSGIYFVRVMNEGTVKVGKIVKY